MTNKPMLSVERDSIALEALKVARQFIANGIELGYIRMPEPETPDSAHGTLPMIDRAIVELRALLDEQTCGACNGCASGCKLNRESPQVEPAAPRQGEPVMPGSEEFSHMSTIELRGYHAGWRAACMRNRPAEQPAQVAEVPEGYCIMPRRLTAENGAKALLLGEFKLRVTKECPECCELEEPTEGCSMCDGEGEYEQRHTIPWDQIKFIYSKAVAGLARINKPL